ncbi:phosphatidylinositol glycan anchor biosynthesis class U protein-like [Liolophura sinensis]|uniref:phosphatidylinositol glycan anchor biosynthesis class U protein-like n=1 Tax=Liolophura sinensis TaxID=3198878 RepID=UPI0031588F7E
MAAPVVVCFLFGILLRLWFFRTRLPTWISTCVEITTPVNAWNRVVEGLSLQRGSVSPYDGDLFHETPLLLKFLDLYTKRWPNSVHLLFIAADFLIGILLVRIANLFARYLLEKQSRDVKSYSLDSQPLLLKSKDLVWLQVSVLVVHFFNPYSLSACLGKSTTVFNSLAVLLTFWAVLKGSLLLSSLCIAVAVYQSLYPIMLVVPAALHLAQKSSALSLWDRKAKLIYFQFFLLTAGWLTGLFYLSFWLEGSWQFIQSVYGFILTVPDLSPNIGIFWYFFTEMFEHFRVFFICVFQINAFIYTVPLAIRLRDHPIFLMYVLVFLIAIFKSYPSYPDVALYLCLLPLWQHIFSFMRNTFVVACMYVSCTVFAPILWHLWIYAGSANANFYFAITLVYTTAEIFLVTDLLFAFLRREFSLLHGPNPKLENGLPAQVSLN